MTSRWVGLLFCASCLSAADCRGEDVKQQFGRLARMLKLGFLLLWLGGWLPSFCLPPLSARLSASVSC